MANGNIAGNNNNNNNSNSNGIGNGNGTSSSSSQSSTTNASTLTADLTTASSSSTVTIGSGGPVDSSAVAATSIINKTTTSLHASREDIASLGGASSVNSQMSLTNNNCNGISSSNNNNNINNNSNSNNGNNVKGSKENLLNTLYNGTPSGSTGTGSIEGGSITGIGIGANLPIRSTEIDDPGDGLGPLPPKWETAYTERGEVYFIDHNTGTSHWLDPRLSKYQKKSLEDCGDDELPYGWEKIEDSLYGTYFIDHVNRRTQYENPVLEAKRRAAEQKQKQQHTLHDFRNGGQGLPPIGNGSASGDIKTEKAVNSTSPLAALNRRPMHPPPPSSALNVPEVKPPALFPYKFTRNPAEMQGERITTTLMKSTRGLGITIVGGDDNVEEFLQIKSIVPNGPAWLDGQLQMGDVLVYVNDTCVLGFTHHEMVNVFQSILPGETVTFEVCRGYPLPFDPNDPNTEVVTTIAVDTKPPDKQRRLLMNLDGNYNFLDISGDSDVVNGSTQTHHMYHPKTSDGFILMKKPEIHSFAIIKGAMGFGFTIADSGFGQCVKKILDRNCCTHLQEGDVLLEINDVSVRSKSHLEVVQILKDCAKTEPTTVKIQRAPGAGASATTRTAVSSLSPNGNVAKLRKNFIGNTATGLFRSKTPTADIYSTQKKEILPMRPKTPLVDTRRARVKTPSNELNDAEVAAVIGVGSVGGIAADARSLAESKTQMEAKSTSSLQEIDAINREIPFMDPYPKLVTSLSERLAEASLRDGANNSRLGFHATNQPLRNNYQDSQEYVTASNHSGSYNPIYGLATMPPPLQLNSVQLNNSHMGTTPTQLYTPPTPLNLLGNYHQQPPQQLQQFQHGESCHCYDCHENKLRHQSQHYYGYQAPTTMTSPYSHAQCSPGSLQAAHIQNERMQKRVNELLSDRRRVGFSPLQAQGTAVTTFPAGYMHHHQQQHSPAVSSASHQQQSWATTLQPTTSDALIGANVSLRNGLPLDVSEETEQYELSEVTLERQALGFGFRIVGGTEEGSQVTVGHVVPGGAADNDHRIATGDEILSIDGVNVVNSSHHKVVSLMGEAALRGQVSMILRRRLHTQPLGEHLLEPLSNQKMLSPATNYVHPQQQLPLRTTMSGLIRYPYDVIVTRHENEGFGFVIISSSNQYYGSTIGKLITDSPADRCGKLKVGDRIIAVNRIDIAGMSHGDVVNLIKESGLHVRLTIGCPKENNDSIGGGSTMQASPGQLSQTQLTSQQLAPQHASDTSSIYFERPNVALNTRLNAGSLNSPQQPQL